MKTSQYWIDHLKLERHVEGGYFRQVLKSDSHHGDRALYTSIYFLLEHGNPSHLHQLTADEVWYYHAGHSLTVHTISESGEYKAIKLGTDLENGEVLQALVPKGTIFGSSVENVGEYALVSCMVAPGFEFDDFKLFTQDELMEKFPQHEAVIRKYALKEIE